MAINLNGLNIIPQGATLTTGGAAPLGLNNEIRGGIHRISGETGDTLTDIDGTLLQAGMLVYNENDSLHYQYINVGDAPATPVDPNDPYRDALGALPNAAANWQMFEPGGQGNIPFGPALPPEGSERVAGEQFVLIGGSHTDRFTGSQGVADGAGGLRFTATMISSGTLESDLVVTYNGNVLTPTSNPPHSISGGPRTGTVDDPFIVDFNDATDIADDDIITLSYPVHNTEEEGYYYRDETNANWIKDGSGGHIPFYVSTQTYNIGDMIADVLMANSITQGVPATDTTILYVYTGAVSGDGSTAEPPFIPGNTGVERSSRDWARPAGVISFFNSAASYSSGSIVEHGRQLYRARRDVIRPEGMEQPVPVEGADWILISDAHVPYYSSSAIYAVGDIISVRFTANQFIAGFPAADISVLLQYIGTGGQAPAPVTQISSGGEQVNVLHQDWALAPGDVSVFSDRLNYSENVIVDAGNGQIFRSRRNIVRASGAFLQDPVQGPDWATVVPGVPAVFNVNGAPAFVGNDITRPEWDLFNRTILGHPLNPDGTVNQGGTPVLIDTNRFQVNNLLQLPFHYSNVNAQSQVADGGPLPNGAQFIDFQPDADNPTGGGLRAAWNRLVSTTSLAITTGSVNYPNPVGTTSTNVSWPTINGMRIATEGSVGVGAFQFVETTDRFQPGTLTYRYPEPLDPSRQRQTQVPTGGSTFFRYLFRPPEIADATDYWLQVDDASTLAPEGLVNGTYLVTSRFATVAGTDVVEFDNIRPISIDNGLPGDQFTFPNVAATTTDAFHFTLFAREIASGAALVNTDLANEVVYDVYELNNTTSQVDFAKLPTVNNVPLATEADVLTDEQRRVIAASNSTGNQDVISNTQYGGGFEVRTESNSRVGTQRSQLGDVALTDPFSLGRTNEWLTALSGGTQVLLEFDNTSGVDFSNVQAGDSLILRLANGNLARDGVAEADAIPAGDYLVFALLAGSEFALTLDARSIRAINGDTSLQNHLGSVALLENHSLPFPENSITIFEGSYSSEWELSTTDNEGYFRVDNRGTHTNRRHYLSGTTLSSEGRVTGTGTPLPAGSIDTFVGVTSGGSVLSFTVLNDVDTSAIAVGDPVQFSTTVAGNNNVFPAGTFIGYRVAGGATNLNLDARRIFPVINGFIQPPLQVTASWNYPVGTEITVTGGLTVEPEFQVDLTDGTIYEMDEEGIFITPPGGTREGFSKIFGTPVSGDIAQFRTPDTLTGTSFEDLLAGELVIVESNIPTDPANLTPNQEYAFRISTRDRQIPAGGPRVTADSFRLSLRTGSIATSLDLPADTFADGNSDTITSNTTRVYRVSWNATSVAALRAATPATGEVLQARLFVPSNVTGDPDIFDLVASHNPDLDTNNIVSSGDPAALQIATWRNIDGRVRGLAGENFQSLLSREGLYIESDVPFDPTELVADFRYSFRISTRAYPTGPDAPTLTAEDFILSTAEGQLPASFLDFERVTDTIASTEGQTVYFATQPTNQRAATPDFDSLVFTLGGVVRTRGDLPGQYQAAIVPNPDTTVGGNVWRITLSASQATAGVVAMIEYDTTTQDMIGTNRSRVYRVSWNAASIAIVQESAARFPDDVLRVLVNLPNVGEFLATHNAEVSGTTLTGSGTAGQLAMWTSANNLGSTNDIGEATATTPTNVDDDSTRVATTEFVHNSVDLLPVLKMPSNGADLDLNQLSYDVTFWRPHLSTSHTTTLRFSDIDVSGINPASVLDDDGTPVTVDANGRFTIQNLNANYRLVFTQNAISILRSASNQLRFAVRFNNGQAGDRSVFGILTGDGGGEFNPQVSQNHTDIIHNSSRIDSNESRIEAIENQINSGAGTTSVASTFFSIDNIPNQGSAGNDDEVISYWNLGEDPNTDASRPFTLNATVTARTDSFTGGSRELPAFIRNRLNTELQNRLERLDAYLRTNPGSAADSTVTGVFGQQFVMAAAIRFSGAGSWITLNVDHAQSGMRVSHTMSTPAPYDFTTDEYTTLECRWFLSRAGSGNTLDYGPTSATTNSLLIPIDPTEFTALSTAINDDARTVFLHWEDSNRRRLIEPVVAVSSPTVAVPGELSNLQYHQFTVSRTTATSLRPTFGSSVRFSEGNGGGAHVPVFGVGVNGIVTGPSQVEVDAGNEFLRADGGWHPVFTESNFPLLYRKTDLFLGAEGESGIASLSVGAGTRNVPWTAYTTGGINYYFLDGVELVNNSLVDGDGLWTVADPRTTPVVLANSANLIG